MPPSILPNSEAALLSRRLSVDLLADCTGKEVQPAKTLCE